jgi:hypothetical protein
MQWQGHMERSAPYDPSQIQIVIAVGPPPGPGIRRIPAFFYWSTIFWGQRSKIAVETQAPSPMSDNRYYVYSTSDDSLALSPPLITWLISF